MSYINKKDLPLLPYNYFMISKLDDQEKLNSNTMSPPETNPSFFVEVDQYMTRKHISNTYHYKPIAKYFNKHEFEK